MFEYLAQVQSAVRRFNYRMNTLVDKFGADSNIVQNVVSTVDVFFPDNYRYKDGAVQLSTPSEIYNNPEMSQALETLDKNVKSWGQYKREAEKSYSEYAEQAEFFKEPVVPIEDFISVQFNIGAALDWMYSSDSAEAVEALEIMQQKGQRKTYSELTKVLDLFSNRK